MDFELNRQDLHDTRFVSADPPSPADGEALLRIESFGLTSNNVTYAFFGDAMNYRAFFPASDPAWGRLNVWGYANVEASRHPDLPRGMRVYGYLPCASHLLVVPDRIDAKGFVDAAPHRRSLPRRRRLLRGGHDRHLQCVVEDGDHRRLPARQARGRRGGGSDVRGQPRLRGGTRRL